MDIKIKKITVKNFKSIKDITLTINDLTVMVGKNGSGKTNIIEAINFNKSLFKLEPMKYPFTKWWGYANLVYNHNIEEPISFSFEIVVDGRNLYYEYEILDNNGLPNFVFEHVIIDDYVDIVRKGSIAEIKHLDKAINKISKMNRDNNDANYQYINKAEIQDKLVQKQYINDISSNQSIMSLGLTGSSFSIQALDIVVLTLSQNKNLIGFQNGFNSKNSIVIISPLIKNFGVPHSNNFYHSLANFAFFGGITNDIFNKIAAIGSIDYKAIKNRVSVNDMSQVAEDGNGIVKMLYQYFLQNRSLPYLVENGIKTFFPEWELNFEAIPDGTITMLVKSGNNYFYPPGIPNGFYKLVMILTVIEQNPEILLIDELENSLHEKMIEYILDTIKARGIKTIISTHSPIVVDLVDLKYLLLVKMRDKQTEVKHIKNPREKLNNLIKEGITPSESLLYGDINS